MTTQWLLSWWNLIFIVPFLLAMLYLGVYTLTGITFGEADADADMDADADVHVDAEVDHDISADADADHDISAESNADHDIGNDHDAGDHDADQDGDHDADDGGGPSSALLAALAWLGVGKVPVSLLLMILLMTWGAVGFGINQAAR